MILLINDIFGIGTAVSGYVRGLLWGIIQVLMSMVDGTLDAMVNGVLSFSILNLDFITGAYKASLAAIFIYLPCKLIYEVLFSILTDNEQTMDISKKILGMITGIMIAVSLSVAIPLANNLTVRTAQIIASDITDNDQSLGQSLMSSVFVGFGGMAEDGPRGASALVREYDKDSFDITERDANDEFVWQFSEFMVIIGMTVYVVMLVYITIQIAARVFIIAMMMVLGPLACTSLTKYQDPQAFNVWKNTLLGQLAMNFVQVVSLSFLSNAVGLINNIETASFTGLPVVMAQLILYMGAFSFIIILPNFVQAMIGGYNAGIMEALNQMQSAMAMTKAGTIGLATAGVAATIGRRSSYTGYREGGLRGLFAGNKRHDGSRVGGIVGNTIGNKDIHGNRQGGIRGAFMGDTVKRNGADVRTGGLAGAIMGSKVSRKNDDGSSSVMTSGGLAGVLAGRRSVETGTDGSMRAVMAGGIAGAVMGTRNMMKTPDESGGYQTSTSYQGGLRGTYKDVQHSREIRKPVNRASKVSSSQAVQHTSGIKSARKTVSAPASSGMSIRRDNTRNRGGRR